MRIRREEITLPPPQVLGKDRARVIPQSGAAGNRLRTAHDQEDQRHPAGCEK